MTILQSFNTAEKKTSKGFFNEKLEGGKKFKITNNFKPAGDQPSAIDQLKKGLKTIYVYWILMEDLKKFYLMKIWSKVIDLSQ